LQNIRLITLVIAKSRLIGTEAIYIRIMTMQSGLLHSPRSLAMGIIVILCC